MSTAISALLSNLGTAASLVIVGGAVLGAYRVVGQIYSRTIGSRRDLSRRLTQLAAGVTLRYIEERFGTPAFTRAVVSAPLAHAQSASRARPTRELVYRERHAWIQILASHDGAVVRFSITVTDPRFRYRTADLTFGHLDVRLGHSRFSDLSSWAAPDGRSLRIGAHNHEYAESYWFGNPGNYQRYVLSSSEVGAGGFGYSIEGRGPSSCSSGFLAGGSPQAQKGRDFDPEAQYARQFRAETTINTLTILGPFQAPEDLAEPRGPDSGQVRVLVTDNREKRLIKRRTRRLMRKAQPADPASGTPASSPETSQSSAHP